jgi:hypothetical protein
LSSPIFRIKDGVKQKHNPIYRLLFGNFLYALLFHIQDESSISFQKFGGISAGLLGV